jgi:hypothetical protein
MLVAGSLPLVTVGEIS